MTTCCLQDLGRDTLDVVNLRGGGVMAPSGIRWRTLTQSSCI